VSGVVLLQPDMRITGDEVEIPAGVGGELRVVSRTGEERTFRAGEDGVVRAPRRIVSHAPHVTLCRMRRGRLRCRRVDITSL
jgi:hypothetical protein